MTPESSDGGFVGRDLQRREDGALLRGAGQYTDNVRVPDATHLAFVRSQYGHATIESVDTADAEAMDGVVGVYTWADLAASDAPGTLPLDTSGYDTDPPSQPLLADGRVCYQGQPIAAVVAEERYLAHDAAGAVQVEYDRLDAVVDPREATGEGAPTLFESVPDNVVNVIERGDEAATERAIEGADHVVELDLENNRVMPTAIEPRAALAEYDAGKDHLTVTLGSQKPHGHRSGLAASLGVPERKIRVVIPDVGGGFGHKGHQYPGETVAAWCSMQLDRPVKWIATRTENYLAGTHGRDHQTLARLGVDDDGTIRGLYADAHASIGGWVNGISARTPGNNTALVVNQYEIPNAFYRTRSVVTNTAPVHAYRGAGRPEAIYTVERLVDVAARELGMDPVELRRRNQIPADDFPHETVLGMTYDSGDYGAALEKALDAIDYDHYRETTRDEQGRYVGVGVACFVENSGGGFESGVVRVHPDGGVTVLAGTHSHGQGHGTTYAQIVADELGVDYDDIEVVEGDTDRIPGGTGTYGSRSTVVGGNAVAESARAVREKAEQIAADKLEASPADIELSDGEFHVAGAPDRSVSFAEIATAAYGGPRPEGVGVGLETTTFYEDEAKPYSFGTHAVAVAVDPSTGEVDIERYVAVDDCGVQINPKLVEGQVHGAVAQGIGQARYEKVAYDDNGTLLTGSLQDYTLPRADLVPEIEVFATVTPSPLNPLGVKGMGESGTMAAPPALVGAVADALSPLGIDHVDMPLTEERVWRAIRDA